LASRKIKEATSNCGDLSLVPDDPLGLDFALSKPLWRFAGEYRGPDFDVFGCNVAVPPWLVLSNLTVVVTRPFGRLL
jgi:hypothetical protein